MWLIFRIVNEKMGKVLILWKGLEAKKFSWPITQEVADIVFPWNIEFSTGGGPFFINETFYTEPHFALQSNAAMIFGVSTFHEPSGVFEERGHINWDKTVYDIIDLEVWEWN